MQVTSVGFETNFPQLTYQGIPWHLRPCDLRVLVGADKIACVAQLNAFAVSSRYKQLK